MTAETGDRARRRPGRLAGTMRVLALAALWAVPAVAVAVAVPVAAELEEDSVATEQPTTVTVGSREVDRAFAVNATVTVGAQPELRSGAEGVLTGLRDEGAIEVGMELFAVDGVPVLAYRGAVLYRDLSLGDSGPDVAALGDYLESLGVLDPASAGSEVDDSMQAAIRDVQDRLGVEKDGVFRRSYVSYVPPGAAEIAGAAAMLGDQITAGTTVLVASAPIDAVTLTPVSTGSLTGYAGLELALRLGDVAVDVPGIEMSGEDAVAVEKALEEAVTAGTAQRQQMDPTIAMYTGGILALRSPVTTGVVPSTAVLVDGDGGACVMVTDDPENPALSATPLTLASAEPGTEVGTVVVDVAAVGSEVIRDVSTLPEEQRACA